MNSYDSDSFKKRLAVAVSAKKSQNFSRAPKQRAKGIIIKPEPLDSTKNRTSPYKKLKTPPTKSLALATKQLASMVKTGLPIVEALNLVAETSDDKSIIYAFRDIAVGIGKGNTIVEMMQKYPTVFDEMYLALADAGEQAGLLAEVLEREAKLLETLAKLKGQIKSALTYPIAISLLVVIVVIVMLVFVIPIFADMYKNAGADLPAMTQIFIDASNWIKNFNNIFILVASLYGVYWSLGQAMTQKSVIRAVDKWILDLPIVGDLTTKSNLANFSRTLASLSSAGVPLLEALLISKRTLSNTIYREIIEDMYQSIRVGDPVYAVLSANNRIPKMFSAMFRIGEQTGELAAMVDKLADFYEEEVSTAVKSLTSILEPMMIVVVAGVVAVILVAMYLPMFGMMNAVK